jgi:O-methyltransferase
MALLIKYIWDIFSGRNFLPEDWKNEVKKGKVSGMLRRIAFSYPDKVRFYSWWLQVERLKRDHIQGSFAELGVYRGDSARIIHQMDPSRKFHLFDTFSGFTGKDLVMETGEAATYPVSSFADTYVKKVIERIAGNENIIPHPGYFPDTAKELENERFALVNMDADLYNPTKAGLEFFYPHLAPGGVIFIHDYNHKWDGILKAVNEFTIMISEMPVLIPDKEGTVLIVKMKKEEGKIMKEKDERR